MVAPPRAKRSKKVTCEECFFARNGLCALELRRAVRDVPAGSPDGLRPPPQMRFVFRQERRRQAAWAFPTAQEQARCTRSCAGSTPTIQFDARACR